MIAGEKSLVLGCHACYGDSIRSYGDLTRETATTLNFLAFKIDFYEIRSVPSSSGAKKQI